jgi:uncharacterized protein YukE
MQDPHADPSSLRAKASSLRDSAEALRATSDRLTRRVDATPFEGPAAMRFRAAFAERRNRALTAAQRLDEVADRVHLEASRAEHRAAEHGPAGA